MFFFNAFTSHKWSILLCEHNFQQALYTPRSAQLQSSQNVECDKNCTNFPSSNCWQWSGCLTIGYNRFKGFLRFLHATSSCLAGPFSVLCFFLNIHVFFKNHQAFKTKLTCTWTSDDMPKCACMAPLSSQPATNRTRSSYRFFSLMVFWQNVSTYSNWN